MDLLEQISLMSDMPQARPRTLTPALSQRERE
jgi:hypothetical protein